MACNFQEGFLLISPTVHKTLRIKFHTKSLLNKTPNSGTKNLYMLKKRWGMKLWIRTSIFKLPCIDRNSYLWRLSHLFSKLDVWTSHINKYLRPKTSVLKTNPHLRKICHIYAHLMHIHEVCILRSMKSQLRFGSASQHFSLQILPIVKCQISEMLDKYLRKIFLVDELCRDWLI